MTRVLTNIFFFIVSVALTMVFFTFLVGALLVITFAALEPTESEKQFYVYE